RAPPASISLFERSSSCTHGRVPQCPLKVRDTITRNIPEEVSMRWTLAILALTLVVTTAETRPQSPASVPSKGAIPTVDDLISLKHVGSPALSPDGRLVAYTVRETNWDENVYKTEIWIADVQTGVNRQLTNSVGAAKSSNAPTWSPDGRRLAFGSDRSGKRQIYLIDPNGGEAENLTSSEDGVGSFKWSPDGHSIAYTASDPQPEDMKN